MNTDKNTVIGFVLMGILLMGYFWYTSTSQQAYLKEQKRVTDSIAKVEATRIKPVDTIAARLDSVRRDSVQRLSAAGTFQDAAIGTEQFATIDNDVMRVTFTSKGGQPKSVELKKYKSYDSGLVVMAGSGFDNISYNINTSPSQASPTSALFFKPSAVTKNADGTQVVSFTVNSADGNSIVHQYVIRKNDYMIDWNLVVNGADRLLSQSSINLNWQVLAGRHQSDIKYERQQARLCYFEDNSYDYEMAAEGVTKNFDRPVKWFSIKQQFFNTALIAKNNFTSGEVVLTVPSDSSLVVGKATANMKVQVPAGATATVPFQLYYGPNEFNVLKKYDMQMESIIDLGSGVFSFVKYINRYIIIPVFDFFASFIQNYGWVIALLTIFIRLVTSPLTYSSYLSGAKMKVLRPELDVLKKKFGDDQQGFAVEQMKLFREAGVNPLGGCIPALLQIPIFFALYSFFNSEISLRGQSFLWAKDLSSYDVIATLPFTIPLGFGDHISLFTITAVVTSFLISIYNMNMTPDQNNPVLKYMPYIFPFVLLFIFNKLPSALTWYYTVSNIITLLLQYIIQNYVINHDKILAKMDDARKKPKTKSKWQERYEQMLESQKKVQELKQRTEKK
ncbi:membrane protein insertase YidC [Segetibacter sp. 3557_3]|uniref:membrane protein insertase YidC n=1 Tax=Segetibacter sp. 3557_3 TaxID=2547429 RepID=UPI0010584131|nr:membrane protein insertase YidC [Segetibacter sp. 3557_3]TDH18297.1 membrane protein insertase YidC [Segetibacter sp. 3557_3]